MRSVHTGFVAALRCEGMIALMLIKGAINGEALLAYVERCRISTLSALHRHHRQCPGTQGRGSRAYKRRSKRLGRTRHLPPYSRDLNPIETAYRACKAFLRKCAERTEEALSRRIRRFARRLQPQACVSFFSYARYAT